MIWQNLFFSIIGFLSSIVLFVDLNLSNVCFTRGCEMLRKSKHDKIMKFLYNVFVTISFGTLLFHYLWYPESQTITYVIIPSTIFAIYLIYDSIKYYQAQCPFRIVSNISMIFLFFIWLSNFF